MAGAEDSGCFFEGWGVVTIFISFFLIQEREEGAYLSI
jgi:hypothetical protein